MVETNDFSTLRYQLKPTVYDSSLLDLLGVKRFDELNQTIKEGVCNTYKSEMLPYCEELIENERIVGRFGMGSNELIDDESWFQDPESLSDLELTKAISSLTFRIEQQKSLNDQAKKDLDILALAKQTLDLDVGFFLADLITEELDVIDDVGD